VVIAGYGVAHVLSQPIRRLTDTALAVSQGDLKVRSGVRTNDEIGLLGHIFDRMTESLFEKNEALVRAYEEQEKEAAYLARIINSSGHAIVVIERDGTLSHMNPQANTLLLEQPNAWRDILSEKLAHMLEGKYIEKRVEIGSFYYNVVSAPVITARGNEIGVVVTIHDITDQIRAEQMRTGFILQMSHELNTPLTAAKGFAEVSHLMLGDQDGEIKHFLTQTIDNIRVLEHMIGEMLDVGAILRGGYEVYPLRFNLSDVINDLIAEYQPIAAQKGITLAAPPANRNISLKGDCQRLRWALSHIFKNACDYTLPGGKIAVSLRAARDVTLISVQDNGVGISLYDQPHIYDQFYRGAPIDAQGKVIDVRGAGLGLYIAQQVVKAHDGHIRVRSRIGKGSRFTVYLPH
jgi:signal transduction histidine kinase